jgi:uncharacterized protein (TIGR02284 family)
METIKESKALSALIIINNDRFEGYKKAAEETKDADLKELFTKFSNQSRGFSEELRKLFPYNESSMEPEKDETTTAGKLFRVWMDIKAALATKDRKAILSSCEFGEDVAKKAYSVVLDRPGDVSLEILTVVRKQNEEIVQAHNQIKAMRDSEK